MALFHSGEVAAGRSELAKARATVNARLKDELQPYTNDVFWFDWILARILVREAETVVSQRDAVSGTAS